MNPWALPNWALAQQPREPAAWLLPFPGKVKAGKRGSCTKHHILHHDPGLLIWPVRGKDSTRFPSPSILVTSFTAFTILPISCLHNIGRHTHNVYARAPRIPTEPCGARDFSPLCPTPAKATLSSALSRQENPLVILKDNTFKTLARQHVKSTTQPRHSS